MYQYSYDFNIDGGSHSNLNFIFQKYGVPNTYVEVGVFEGSTIFHVADQYSMYNNNLNLIAIDPHRESVDMIEQNMLDKGDTIAERFLHNLNINSTKNIEYIRKHSTDGLLELINRKQTAELIYIDGDHRADQVLTDLVLAYQILVVGGVILCDDATTWKYVDKNNTSSAQLSPRMAIEFFIQCNWHNIECLCLPCGTQTAFMKKR